LIRSAANDDGGLSSVSFERFHLGKCIGRYWADLIVERTVIVEVKRGPTLDPQAIPQLLNYVNLTKLPLGLVLYSGPTPKMRRVIRDDRREYPVSTAEQLLRHNDVHRAVFVSGFRPVSVVSGANSLPRSEIKKLPDEPKLSH
jgi:PD-(D/E)XK nuclease superfamily protein